MGIVDRIFELVDIKYNEQKAFAAKLGLDPTIPSRWRKGKSTSYQKYLPQIAEALGTTTEYLLTGEGPKKKSAPVVSDSDTLTNEEEHLGTVTRIFELADNQFKEQKEFAAVIGVDPNLPSRWRNRKSQSYQKYLPQIAEALGTTTEYLLTGSGPKKRICSNPTVLSDLPDEALNVAQAYDCADEKSRAIVRLALGLDKDI